MNSTAVAVPDVQFRWLRNSFASMKCSMPIIRALRMNWPTSAISGGFRPPERAK